MADYTAQAKTAERLIGSAGQEMTLYRLTLGAYDPVNPQASVPTIQNQTPCKGVVLPISAGGNSFDNELLRDPARRRSARFVILAGRGLPFNPEGQDVLRTAEGLYRILGATPLDPNGQGAIIFSLGCTLDPQLSIP